MTIDPEQLRELYYNREEARANGHSLPKTRQIRTAISRYIIATKKKSI